MTPPILRAINISKYQYHNCKYIWEWKYLPFRALCVLAHSCVLQHYVRPRILEIQKKNLNKQVFMQQPVHGCLSYNLTWKPCIPINICHAWHANKWLPEMITNSFAMETIRWADSQYPNFISQNYHWTQFVKVMWCFHINSNIETEYHATFIPMQWRTFSFWDRSFGMSSPQRAWRPMRVQEGGCTKVSRFSGRLLLNLLDRRQ